MSRRSESASIGVLAERQFGLVTRAQALEARMARRTIDRRLEAGAWRRILPGVYALAGVSPGWRGWLLAAQLWAGDEACVSHRAAGRLLGLDGVTAALAEITLPHRRRSTHPNVLMHWTRSMPAEDLMTLGPFRLTGPARTLIDLAGVVEAPLLERALDDALRRELTSVPRLRRRLSELRASGRDGVEAMDRLLRERDRVGRLPESLLEARLVRLIRAAGLPDPVRQHPIRADGRLVARVDLAYPERLVAIECDGYRYHSGKVVWERDLRRRNRLTALGWSVLHVTWHELESYSSEVAEAIAGALNPAAGACFGRDRWNASPAPGRRAVPGRSAVPGRRST